MSTWTTGVLKYGALAIGVFVLLNIALGSVLHPHHGVWDMVSKSVFTGIFLVIWSIAEGVKHIASLLAIAALLVSLWWTRHVEKIPNWLKYVAALLILEGIGAYLTQYLAV